MTQPGRASASADSRSAVSRATRLKRIERDIDRKCLVFGGGQPNDHTSHGDDNSWEFLVERYWLLYGSGGWGVHLLSVSRTYPCHSAFWRDVCSLGDHAEQLRLVRRFQFELAHCQRRSKRHWVRLVFLYRRSEFRVVRLERHDHRNESDTNGHRRKPGWNTRHRFCDDSGITREPDFQHVS